MKLLVATAFPPNAPGGGPAVVRQMLRGFASSAISQPESAIFWWSCHSEKDRRFGQEVSGHWCAGIPDKLIPSRRFTRLKAFLLEHVWAPWAAAHLLRTIREIQPDCIWMIPHDWSIYPLWRVMAEGKWRMADGTNPRVHVTIQDYPDAHNHGAVWGRARAERMARMQEEIYCLATTRDATSHPMLDDLEKRTGAKGVQMLHAGLEPEDFDFLKNPAAHRPPSAIIKIAYAGTILVPREFALFVEALESIRCHPTGNSSIQFHLWGAHSYRSEPWFRPSWMVEHGNLPEQELLGALRECHWGFIPMSLSDSDPRYNRFSFPTKFITCLAAGLPVITIGHPESSVMKMAAAYNVGVTITSPQISVEELASALSAPGTRERCRAEALRCARAEFDAEKIRRRLWDCFAGGIIANE
ncbi:MAG: hypothetical protein WCO94_04910 [Verrucomicrobiota bacterium]